MNGRLYQKRAGCKERPCGVSGSEGLPLSHAFVVCVVEAIGCIF